MKTKQTELFPKIRALAPWFGAKRTLAEEIVLELGPHQKYDEPFCGSCAIVLAKPEATHETINDLHGDLINLAKVLQVQTLAEQLYSRLSSTLFHESLILECREAILRRGEGSPAEGLDLQRAYEFMVLSWFGRNGVAGTPAHNSGFCVRYTKNGGHAATRWTSAIESIPAWHHRLRKVTILNRNGFEIIDRLEDSKGCVIYLDPPYLKKGARYVHDFGTEDHSRLAEGLRRFKRTRVVVSYYDDPRLAALYPGWTVRPLKATKAMVNQGRRDKGGAVAAPEVLLINGPSLVEAL